MGKILKALSIICVFFFVFAMIGIAPVAYCLTSDQEEAGGYVSRGITANANGRVDEAITDFTMAIKIEHKNAMAYYLRAKAYEYQDNYNLALQDYTQAVYFNPNFFTAYYYRGFLYQRRGLFDEAIEDFLTIVKMDAASLPFRANASNNIGLLYHQRGEYLKAVGSFTRAIQFVPDIVNVYYNRGCSYVDLGDYALAIEDFNRELLWSRNSPAPKHYSLALKYFLKKNYSASWLETLALMKSGEKVSRRFLVDLMHKRRNTIVDSQQNDSKPAQVKGAVLHSGY